MTSVVERGNIAITAPSDRPDPKRWVALAIIAVAQLMVVLDATIVNIALPHAQAALGISDADRSWVVTAYTLTFGGLLLLGGRIADYWGRKRTFLLGIVGFALASALGGIAQNGETLFAARALQGAFGALLAPASLALLTVLFTEPRERARAFGVYGAIAGGGAAVGLILGGVLTEYLDWRWCLLVNIPIALIAGAFGLRGLHESRAHGNTRYDIPGAVLITLGLAGLVYGFTKAADPRMSDHRVTRADGEPLDVPVAHHRLPGLGLGEPAVRPHASPRTATAGWWSRRTRTRCRPGAARRPRRRGSPRARACPA